jgi:DNA polymerase phi
VHGNQQFDKLTRTKTVESILSTMSAEGIKDYIAHLLGQADGGPASGQYGGPTLSDAHDNSPRARSDVQVINARRSWIIEQFTALVRNGAIPKSDEWVQLILDWFIVHGIFSVKKSSQGSLIFAVRIPFPSLLKTDCPY